MMESVGNSGKSPTSPSPQPGEIVRRQPTEIERQEHWEQSANELVERYAGFTDAHNLTDQEKILALVSLVPMALRVVDEARDTIQRLNEEIEAHDPGTVSSDGAEPGPR